MSRDNVLNRRTPIDDEFEKHRDSIPPRFTVEMIESCTRLMARQKGIHATAVFVQKIADECAGIELKPIDHWRSKPDRHPGRVQRLWKGAFSNSLLTFYFGLLIGLYLGGWQ